MADEVHQVRGILAVMDGELRIEAEFDGIFTQNSRSDAVERAGPGKGIGEDAGLISERLCANALHAFAHLGSRPPGKRHQEDTPWIGTGNNKMSDAMGARVGLARSGTGDDQQRAGGSAIWQADAMDDCGALTLI